MCDSVISSAKASNSILIKILLVLLISSAMATNVFAVNIYTKKGPGIAISSSGNMHLYFTGHNNDYIWEAKYSPETRSWTSQGRVLNSAGNAARTTERPAPLHINEVFFHGNVANDYIWHVDRGSSSSEWGRPHYLQYFLRTGDPARDTFLMRSSPAVMTYSWAGSPRTPTVFFTDLVSRRITYTTRRESGSSIWSRPGLLPAQCVSNVGPAIANYGGAPLVFYAKRNTHEIFLAAKNHDLANRDEDDWTVLGIPRAFTTAEPSATNINDGGVLLVYKGHNNNKIWLRLYRPAFGNMLQSSSWRRLGYVSGVETDQAPAIAYRDGTLVLAFKNPDTDAAHPVFTVDIGFLTIDESNRHDTPGHTFTSFR
ncbi:MAG: hypothetical protein OEU26_31380 [Candidatus Tectomicrobia bacterium]|nr:hypothetical protein [Candidatus Tectomicrobia bacterium]